MTQADPQDCCDSQSGACIFPLTLQIVIANAIGSRDSRLISLILNQFQVRNKEE